jgi:hypothetical protein
MKKLILVSLFIANSAFAQSPPTTINNKEFVVLNDFHSPEVTVFLSYTGEIFNQCGIQIRINGFTSGETIAKHFEIIEDDVISIKIQNSSLVAALKNAQVTTFGHFFTIRTLSGNDISQEILNMSESQSISALVENLTCEQPDSFQNETN